MTKSNVVKNMRYKNKKNTKTLSQITKDTPIPQNKFSYFT